HSPPRAGERTQESWLPSSPPQPTSPHSPPRAGERTQESWLPSSPPQPTSPHSPPRARREPRSPGSQPPCSNPPTPQRWKEPSLFPSLPRSRPRRPPRSPHFGALGAPGPAAPRKSQWWGARRLLALIGWGRAGDPGPAPGQGLFSRVSQVPQYLSPHQPPADIPEHFQICFNFARHLFDLCVVTLLCACSPAFRLLLDILGFRGPLKVWLHGLATFLVTTYGMYLALWLVQKYLLQFACLYGFLQTLVLCVSIRAAEEEENGGGPAGLDPGGGAEAERTE
uniref:Chromosome 6 open reading frame 47 n=1 Tax=Chrysemys picta bellii TaxID=8478 RepID=A0A8C3HMP2_CHRPI